MLHFPFLQTPVSRMLPVPPSQVCPSVLAPEAAAALFTVSMRPVQEGLQWDTGLPFELPFALASSLFAAALPLPPPPRGIARACPANMAVMIQVKVDNCILTCLLFVERKIAPGNGWFLFNNRNWNEENV